MLRIEATGVFLFSDATLAELAEVLARRKFDAYVDRNLRDRFLASILACSERVDVRESINVCRDPKDDRILEVAVTGGADYLITGDQDLLMLENFRGIPILTPAAFLLRVS